jgi:ubiquinone/menaquinone biosynthesis C-methylase UbiE
MTASHSFKVEHGDRVFVPESTVGFWFLGTDIWEWNVIKIALDDLQRLMPEASGSYPVILDAGCGQGRSFALLQERFSPQRIIGVEYEEKCIKEALKRVDGNPAWEVRPGSVSHLELADASVDMVFCHQTFHHLVHQHEALREFYRVLKPGGLLLFAESTRAYIESWIIRWFFRHPMEVQRSADEYMQMIRDAGFQFGEQNVSLPYLWWSRSDLGALEFFGLPVPKQGEREETLVNLVARKP